MSCLMRACLAYKVISLVPLITIYSTGSMPLLVDVSSPRVSPAQGRHFGVDMHINDMVIFINFLSTKV